MTRALLLAAGALLSLAEARVHKMPLQKVPLSDQLVRQLYFSSFNDLMTA